MVVHEIPVDGPQRHYGDPSPCPRCSALPVRVVIEEVPFDSETNETLPPAA
jgi:hypothetical protein